ncbi:MAG: TnsA endonuclease N-terminal domain-containing protein [Gammaproteobacteria bacterium]|nr:TnsA endonuclease N-terminal domain-containing protein [Gammaproteobacteria bacterium]MCP5136351.1 TnsA endonuclease N-terminal domain-containing protein [Gammaproteobacteria bacterium]
MSKPARKIPKSYTNVTGRMAKRDGGRVAFESLLEKDFFMLLDADPQVREFREQPLEISYRDQQGTTRKYFPDVLVMRHAPGETWLCEVKPRRQIARKWAELKPKFKAAIRYCKARGWRFRILTEKEIRTPYLENIRFLRGYLRVPDRPQLEDALRAKLNSMGEATPFELLSSLSDDEWVRADYATSLWRLVATGDITVDLTTKIDTDTVLRPAVRGDQTHHA